MCIRDSQCGGPAMVNRERDNAVALPNERFPRRHLHIIDRKVLLVASERHGLPQKSLRLWRAKQSHRVGAPLERHGTHESGNTEYVVRMHVRKEDLADVERNAVAHHLALSPLATIEEKGLSPTADGQRGDVALNGRSRSRCS